MKSKSLLDSFGFKLKKPYDLPSNPHPCLLRTISNKILGESNNNNDYNYINSYEDCSSYTYSRVNQISRSMRLKSKPNGLIFRPSEEKGTFDKDKIGALEGYNT